MEKGVNRKRTAADLEAIGVEMGNLPPQALDVEEAVLGACYLSRPAWMPRWRN